ncbi:hypothetical protein [Cryptosporangium arvum]|uniref:Uncharacterized protein n=1 Tax=Cryptosporangium arvum DSM 44712 TaxID=927661 RepID=A0A011ADA3_9ACTN|nr:hypothetical protein [Cryptosporangium arvum]EXG80036.1 hypothetical protein CryarDRAFT_1095 [Cryptosporangium arvum DSM 44712]
MKTALLLLLAILGAGGVAAVSLFLITRATVRLAVAGGAFLLGAACFVRLALEGEPAPTYVGMLAQLGLAAALVVALVRYGHALDGRDQAPMPGLRDREEAFR